MGLDKIIEYQSIDMKIYSLENDFQKSDVLKNLRILKSNYSEKNEELTRLMKETQELFSAFEKGVGRMPELDGMGEYLARDTNSINDAAELDLYDKSLIKYEELISSIERDMNRIARRFSELKIEVQRLIEQRIEINNMYMQHKRYHDDMVREMKQKAAPFMRELESLRGALDEKLFEKYEARRTERKMPAFVEYMDGNCSGCGMEIFIEVNEKLVKSGDMAECPECRRIVYKA